MPAPAPTSRVPRSAQRDLPPAERTVPRLFARQAETHPNRPLATLGGASRTYAEQAAAIARAAGTLADAGVGRGDRVAVMGGNEAWTVDLIFGAMWLGAVAVPINTAARGPQLEHVLSNSGARLLAMEARLLAALESVTPPSTLEHVWACPAGADPGRLPPGYAVTPAPEPGDGVEPAAVAPEDTAAILYTSGTTGAAKGVCCPHAQLFWFALHSAEHLGIEAGDVLYTSLPIFHINALTAVLQAALCGASIVVDHRFSASRFTARLAEVDASVTYLLGAMVTILARQAPQPSDREHRVRVALAPGTPPDLHDVVMERFGFGLVEAYASTETNVVIGAPLDEQRPGYMGRVVDDFELRVVDEHDEEVEDGRPGELILRHAQPFAFATGYFGLPEKTVEAWRNLWFHTGDRVVRDRDGRVRFVDRVKDAIRRRGENISSFEVEQVVMGHPDVAQVAAYPLPSELGEDEVAVVVVLRPGADWFPEDLVRHCEARLAYYAIPRFVDVVDALPVTESGKVRKFVLREQGVTATMWDRETAGVRLRRDVF